MECPRCATEVTGSGCPECGKAPEAGKEAGSGVDLESEGERPKRLLGTRAAADPEPEWSDWRLEIRQRLDEHKRKKSSHQVRDGGVSDPAGESGQDLERPLFEYRLQQAKVRETRKKVVHFARTQRAQLAEKPLIRTPIKPTTPARPRPPQQRAFRLDAPMEPPPPAPAPREDQPEPPSPVSNEILLSRLLAGIVDLLFALSVAGLFLATGSWMAPFDLFSPRSMELGTLLAVALFIFNSFFFLILNGQTPGMYVTELGLVGDPPGKISMGALTVRILLFLPVAVTLVGLAWSVVDPLCRCAHDLLSGTRVVPLNPQAVRETSSASSMN